MSTEQPENLVNEYADWLKRTSKTIRIGEWQEISLPFLDSFNDYTVFYARANGDQIELSDDGATLENLHELGINVSGKRRERIEHIVMQFGASITSDGEIVMNAPLAHRTDAVNEFIQAITRIQSFSESAQRRITSYFADDVAAELDKMNIYYMRNMQVQGTTSYSHTFDFVFQKSRNHPDRFCYTPSSLSKATVGLILWSWEDTQKAPHRDNARLIVIADDRIKDLSSKALNAFKNVGVKAIRFSELDDKAYQVLGS